MFIKLRHEGFYLQIKYICDLNSDVSFVFKVNLVRTQTVLFLFYCLPAEVSVHFSPITASEIVKQTQSTWISADVHTAWLTQFKRACTYHNHMSDLMCNASSCLLSRLWMVTAGLYLLKCACVMRFYCNVWHFLLLGDNLTQVTQGNFNIELQNSAESERYALSAGRCCWCRSSL